MSRKGRFQLGSITGLAVVSVLAMAFWAGGAPSVARAEADCPCFKNPGKIIGQCDAISLEEGYHGPNIAYQVDNGGVDGVTCRITYSVNPDSDRRFNAYSLDFVPTTHCIVEREKENGKFQRTTISNISAAELAACDAVLAEAAEALGCDHGGDFNCLD